MRVLPIVMAVAIAGFATAAAAQPAPARPRISHPGSPAPPRALRECRLAASGGKMMKHKAKKHHAKKMMKKKEM